MKKGRFIISKTPDGYDIPGINPLDMVPEPTQFFVFNLYAAGMTNQHRVDLSKGIAELRLEHKIIQNDGYVWAHIQIPTNYSEEANTLFKLEEHPGYEASGPDEYPIWARHEWLGHKIF